MPQPTGPQDLHVVPVTGEDWVVYRVVATDDRDSEAFLESFKSSHERGVPPRRWSPEERFRVIHMGVSCFSTRRQAEKVALRWGLGDYVAELRLPADQGVSAARWGSRGHLTVWAEAVMLAETATDIVRVTE